MHDVILLRLGHGLDALVPTLHNGPGWRIGLWTQGCVHRCTTQCLSPHLLDPNAGRLFDVDLVAEVIFRAVAASAPDAVDGVTVLGGEPFEQAVTLTALLGPLRKRGLSTMVYSGHTWEHLQRSSEPGIADLLAVTDLLVDGPYLPAYYSETIAWRGSTNQRLLCLTDRYTPDKLAAAFARQGKGSSIRISPRKIAVSGLQVRQGAQSAEDILAPRRLASDDSNVSSPVRPGM